MKKVKVHIFVPGSGEEFIRFCKSGVVKKIGRKRINAYRKTMETRNFLLDVPFLDN